MAQTNQTSNLRIDLDSKDFRLSDQEQAKFDSDLETLRRAVACFPDPELKIELSKQSYYRVRTSLILPSRTLFTADEDRDLHPAWERCIRKLVGKVQGLKEALGNKPAYSKEAEGTLHNVRPAMEPDVEQLNHAIAEMDYVAFRNAMSVYEEAVERRVGRWAQRYPIVEDSLGDGLAISEIVEEVFLNAFERFDQRPAALRLGEWLESLIDPSIKALVNDPGFEKENLSFIESAKEIEDSATGRRR
jgi:hypothetical protein